MWGLIWYQSMECLGQKIFCFCTGKLQQVIHEWSEFWPKGKYFNLHIERQWHCCSKKNNNNYFVTGKAILNFQLTKTSNSWRPTLLEIGHNDVAHAKFLTKILNFKPEDKWKSALRADCERISFRKKAKTQFESKVFFILLNLFQDDIFI